MRISKFFSDIERYLKFLLVFLIFYPYLSIAQTEDILYRPGENQYETILVYIDYAESDDTERYLRSEIPFATYVRDPRLAQIHILIADQRTASGGRQFNISFIGKEDYKGQDQTLFYISPQSDTDD